MCSNTGDACKVMLAICIRLFWLLGRCRGSFLASRHLFNRCRCALRCSRYGGMLPPIPPSTNVLGRSFLTPYARWGYAVQLHGDSCNLHARTHANRAHARTHYQDYLSIEVKKQYWTNVSIYIMVKRSKSTDTRRMDCIRADNVTLMLEDVPGT